MIVSNNGFFFFKQKTAYEISTRDWSSDVCSSDLDEERVFVHARRETAARADEEALLVAAAREVYELAAQLALGARSRAGLELSKRRHLVAQLQLLLVQVTDVAEQPRFDERLRGEL